MLIVFGANGGIGSRLLEHACSEPGQQVLGAFRDDCDVESESSVEGYFSGLSRIQADGEPLQAINATGNLVNGMMTHAPPAETERTVSVNVTGSYRIARHFLRSATEGSSLLLLSSVVGRLGVPGAASYGMCKSAIHGLVRSACKEYARRGARINAIEMGYFDAGMIDRIPEKNRNSIRGSVPLGRFGHTEELWAICRAVLGNGYMTGQVVGITGGL